jgi:hypothetical protein
MLSELIGSLRSSKKIGTNPMKGSSGGNSRKGVCGFAHHEEEVGAGGAEFNDQSNSMGIEGG